MSEYVMLTSVFSSLYKKTSYLIQEPYVVDRIIEYDIKSANTSVLRNTGKFKSSVLDRIEALSPIDRKVAIGKWIRSNREMQGIIAHGIRDSKRKLFMDNSIKDTDIISIKNDAVFIRGVKLREVDFGHVHFAEKNVYSVFMCLEKVEYYYSSKRDDVDVKGVSDTVVSHPDHQDGIIKFIRKVMHLLSLDNTKALKMYLIDFVGMYKRLELPVTYYREFNAINVYRTHMEISGHGFNLVEASESDKEMINGIYNYTKIILPIVRMFI